MPLVFWTECAARLGRSGSHNKIRNDATTPKIRNDLDVQNPQDHEKLDIASHMAISSHPAL